MIKLADNISTLHNISRMMNRGNPQRVAPIVPTSVMAPGVNFNNASDDPLHPSVSVNGKPPQSFASASDAEVTVPARMALIRGQPLSHGLSPDVMAKLVNTFPALADMDVNLTPGERVKARTSVMYGNKGLGFMNTAMPSSTPSRDTVNYQRSYPWNATGSYGLERGSLNDIYSAPFRNKEKYHIPLPNFQL